MDPLKKIEELEAELAKLKHLELEVAKLKKEFGYIPKPGDYACAKYARTEGDFLFVASGNLTKCFYISVNGRRYGKDGNFSSNNDFGDYRKCTPEEIAWLDYCIVKGKYYDQKEVPSLNKSIEYKGYKVGDYITSLGYAHIGKITRLYDGDMYEYWGYNVSGCFRPSDYYSMTDEDRLASANDIKDFLVRVAKEQKGFEIHKHFLGVRDVSKDEHYCKDEIAGIDNPKEEGQVGSVWYYNEDTDTLYTLGHGVHIVYEKGVWATKPVSQQLPFGDIMFTIYPKSGKATCSSGTITKAAVHKVLQACKPIVAILGHQMEITGVKFGCQTGTLEEIEKIYDAM